MTDEMMILSCIPVCNAANIKYAGETFGDDIPWLKPYAGSVLGVCSKHGGDVWIGPKQQEKLDEDPDIPVMCHFCAMITVAEQGGGELDIRPLGTESTGFIDD